MALAVASVALGGVAEPAPPTVVEISLDNPSIVSDDEILALFKPGVGEPYSKAMVNRSLSILSHVSGIKTVHSFVSEIVKLAG